MKYIKKYGLSILLIISLSVNLIGFFRLDDSNRKIEETNRLVSLHVEQSIRQSMGFVGDLKVSQSQQSMQSLQRTMQDLAVTFKHWVEINQMHRKPNKVMQQGLSGIESMRNLIVHHLNNQYIANNNQFSEYDLELLDKLQENLDHLLTVYNNIKDRIPELSSLGKSDGGLVQVAGNIEDMTRLYRHSIIPNNHPNYISFEEAVAEAIKQIPLLKEYKLYDENSNKPLIKEGVHYYQLKFSKNKDKDNFYIVSVDAINAGIRSFEVTKENTSNKYISKTQAMEIALEYLQQFYQGEVVEEMFEMKVTGEKNTTIFAFRFTPVINDIKMVSDAISINVSSATGDIVQYSNDFSESNIPNYTQNSTKDEIIESNKEVFGDSEIEYEGLMLIRSFQTRYVPRVAYSFKMISNQQPMLVFFDVETGKQISSLYYIYEAVNLSVISE